MGGTSIPQPSQLYLDAANTLYLQQRGFDGTLQSLFTPENASSTSEARGDQILDSTILQEFNSGDVGAQNPIVVFGYSQAPRSPQRSCVSLPARACPAMTCTSC